MKPFSIRKYHFWAWNSWIFSPAAHWVVQLYNDTSPLSLVNSTILSEICTFFRSVYYTMVQVVIVTRYLYFVALEQHPLWTLHFHNDRSIRGNSWNHLLTIQFFELSLVFSFQSDQNVISYYFWNTKCLWSGETLENEDCGGLARRRRTKNRVFGPAQE